jgi:hypothetical protein
MMHYVQRLTVLLEHSYYGDAPVPLELVPADPRGFERCGFLLRRQGNRVMVVGEISDPVPNYVEFDILAATTDLHLVTRYAAWTSMLYLDMPNGTDAVGYGPARPSPRKSQSPMARLARLRVALSDDEARAVTLRFEAVEALWAYHLTGNGNRDGLNIVDPAERITFSPQGTRSLPDGREAQVIRSDQPLPARARPTQKFMLQRASAFGPETLIPVLPAAGMMFKPIPEEEGAPARLQSDIYVTLW